MPLDMPISFLILGCFRAFMRFQGYNCTLLIIKILPITKLMFLEHKSPWDCSKQVHKKECLPLSVMFSSRSDPDLKKIFHHLLKILKHFSQPLSKTELYKTFNLGKRCICISCLPWVEMSRAHWVVCLLPLFQSTSSFELLLTDTDKLTLPAEDANTHTHTPWNIDYLSLNEPRLTTLTDTTLAPWRTRESLKEKGDNKWWQSRHLFLVFVSDFIQSCVPASGAYWQSNIPQRPSHTLSRVLTRHK